MYDSGSDYQLVTLKLTPAVLFLRAYNIVLTQIRPRLHFDQLQLYYARALQQVPLTNGDVGRLVLRHQIGLFTIGHSSAATTDYDPVLGVVAMHLHRQPGTRLYRNTLALVPAPENLPE